MSSPDDIAASGWGLSSDTRRALRLEAARRALRRRDFRRAVVEAEELLDEFPGDEEGLYTLAEAAMELRDHQVAREAWRALVDSGIERASVWTQLGLCAFEVGDFEDAAEHARRALVLHDDHPEAWYLLGLTTEHLRGHDAAREHFERAHRASPLSFPLPLLPSDEDVHLLLGEALDELPADVAAVWSGVPLRLLDLPDASELASQVPPISPRVLALYEGPPPSEADGSDRPPGLRVFRVNLAHQDSPQAAAQLLADALEQEALDWLPANEE